MKDIRIVNITYYLLVLCSLIVTCLISCEKKNSWLSKEDLERLNKSQPEFDTDNQIIYYKTEMKYDIKGDIEIPFNVNNPNTFDLACLFSFFNYGEDIRLFNACGDDFFITGIGTIQYAYVLQGEDNINITSKQHNEKYGDWAFVNLTLGNNRFYVNDVYMTPLAMKAYKKGECDSFIFIQFVANEKYMNVIFYGGPKECIIVHKLPEYIFPDRPLCDIDGLINGPGRFWHQKMMP